MIIDENPVEIPCTRCNGTGYVKSDREPRLLGFWCTDCGGMGFTWFDRSALLTLAHNLAVAAFGGVMFRAGDNFGFHMGGDDHQCTCQWSPGKRAPYRGATRCEHEEYERDGDISPWRYGGES